MTLFTKLAPLVQAGVVVHLTLRQVGKDMQLEILPVCDAGKTGITVPPRAFLATAEELDEKVPSMLEAYVSAANNINDQIAVTVAVMEKAQEDAREATKKAQQTKATTPARSTTNATPGSKPAKVRNTNAGFLDEAEGDGADEVEDDAEPASTSGVEEADPATPEIESLF